MVHFLLHDFDKKEGKKFKKRKKRSQAFLIGRLCWRSSLPKPQVLVPGAGSTGVQRDMSSRGCGACSLRGPASPPQTRVWCWSS